MSLYSYHQYATWPLPGIAVAATWLCCMMKKSTYYQYHRQGWLTGRPEVESEVSAVVATPFLQYRVRAGLFAGMVVRLVPSFNRPLPLVRQ